MDSNDITEGVSKTVTATVSLDGVDVEVTADVRAIHGSAEIESEPLIDGISMSRLGLSISDEECVVGALCDVALR